MTVEIEDRISVLMAPRAGFHLAQIADGGALLKLVDPFGPERRSRRLPNSTGLVKVVIPVGEDGMFLRIDPHPIESEKLEVFLLLAATAVIAVFDIGERRKRERLGERGLTDPGHRYRCKTAANPFRQPQRFVDIGFMTFSVALAVTIHLPAGRHERNGILVVVQVAQHAERKLFHGVVTGGAPRPFPRTVQRGQQKSGKNGDDCHNDKKFNQSKILSHFFSLLSQPSHCETSCCPVFHYTRKKRNKQLLHAEKFRKKPQTQNLPGRVKIILRKIRVLHLHPDEITAILYTATRNRRRRE